MLLFEIFSSGLVYFLPLGGVEAMCPAVEPGKDVPDACHQAGVSRGWLYSVTNSEQIDLITQSSKLQPWLAELGRVWLLPDR